MPSSFRDEPVIGLIHELVTGLLERFSAGPTGSEESVIMISKASWLCFMELKTITHGKGEL